MNFERFLDIYGCFASNKKEATVVVAMMVKPDNIIILTLAHLLSHDFLQLLANTLVKLKHSNIYIYIKYIYIYYVCMCVCVCVCVLYFIYIYIYIYYFCKLPDQQTLSQIRCIKRVKICIKLFC